MKYMELTKKQNDLVTIVVPAHNAEDYLKENIEAILGQTYKNLEVIYVCDGCTDRTVEILEIYQNDSRLKVIVQKENQGAAISRNIGMEMATGDWIIFWDADDLFAPEMIEVMVQAAQDTGADVTGCYWEYFDEKPSKRHKVYNEWRKMYCSAYPIVDIHKNSKYIMQLTDKGPCTKLVHKTVYRKPEIYFQNIPSTNDVYYSMMVAMNANKIVFVDKVLLFYRSNNGRTTLTTQRKRKKNYIWEAYDKIYEYILLEEKNHEFLQSFYNDVLDIVLICSSEDTSAVLIDELVNNYFEKWGMNHKGIEEQLHLINKITYRKIRAGERGLRPLEIHKLARIEFLDNISSFGCSVWGTGMMGEVLFESVEETDIKFVHVYDSASDKWGMDYHGYCIECFEDFQADHIIVTTPAYYEEIRKQIGDRAEHVYNLEHEIKKIPE